MAADDSSLGQVAFEAFWTRNGRVIVEWALSPLQPFWERAAAAVRDVDRKRIVAQLRTRAATFKPTDMRHAVLMGEAYLIEKGIS